MVITEPIEKSQLVFILIVIMFVEKGKRNPCDIWFIMKSGLMRVSGSLDHETNTDRRGLLVNILISNIKNNSVGIYCFGGKRGQPENACCLFPTSHPRRTHLLILTFFYLYSI
jgi:hypothetical protein